MSTTKKSLITLAVLAIAGAITSLLYTKKYNSLMKG